MSVSDEEKKLFEMGPNRPGQFWGRDDYGAFFPGIKYRKTYQFQNNLLPQ
jgi:hypothetical protein